MKKEVDEIYVQVLTRLSITAHSQFLSTLTCAVNNNCFFSLLCLLSVFKYIKINRETQRIGKRRKVAFIIFNFN